MRKYWLLINYPLRHRKMLALILVLTLLTSITSVLQPWPMKILVDYALCDTEVPSQLNFIFKFLNVEVTTNNLLIASALASICIFVVNSVISTGSNLAWIHAGQNMVYDLAGDLFRRLQQLSLLFHSRSNVGDSLNRIEGDAYCVYTVTAELIISPLLNIVTLISIGIVAWQLDPELTILSFVIAPLLVTTSLVFAPKMKRRTRQTRELSSKLMSLVQQTLSAIPVIKIFSREKHNTQQFQLLTQDIIVNAQRNTLLNQGYGSINGFISSVGRAIVLFVGCHKVFTGAIPLGSLLVILAYLRAMQGSFRGLLQIYTKLKKAEVMIERTLEILQSKEQVIDHPDAILLEKDTRVKQGHIRFKNVTFGYDTGCPILKNVNFEAKPGEIIALVGSTGAGKSTFVSMITRFFDPWDGCITFDGTDISKIKLSSLREHIALLLQEPFLLPLTIAENIAYGKPDASQEEIIKAAEIANADFFIRQLPGSYNTVLGERGSTLSGGQKQRIAIARAVIKDASILILDEPTSALDVETEALLLDALNQLMSNRTTIIIAHRLSTIRNANRIIMLENGEIVESGTHTELMSLHGAYQHFYSLQFPGQ